LGVRDDQEAAAQSDPSLQGGKIFALSLAGCLRAAGGDEAISKIILTGRHSCHSVAQKSASYTLEPIRKNVPKTSPQFLNV
jgi:hypothetical protein